MQIFQIQIQLFGNRRWFTYLSDGAANAGKFGLALIISIAFAYMSCFKLLIKYIHVLLCTGSRFFLMYLMSLLSLLSRRPLKTILSLH